MPGQHSYDVVKDSVTIGRGGIAYPVDVRIAASPDVSREHARIRRDPQTGRFFLIDLSSLGTTLNGRHVPRGYDESRGDETRKRRRDAAAGRGADRSGRHRVPRFPQGRADDAAPVGAIRCCWRCSSALVAGCSCGPQLTRTNEEQ